MVDAQMRRMHRCFDALLRSLAEVPRHELAGALLAEGARVALDSGATPEQVRNLLDVALLAYEEARQ